MGGGALGNFLGGYVLFSATASRMYKALVKSTSETVNGSV